MLEDLYRYDSVYAPLDSHSERLDPDTNQDFSDNYHTHKLFFFFHILHANRSRHHRRRHRQDQKTRSRA